MRTKERESEGEVKKRGRLWTYFTEKEKCQRVFFVDLLVISFL